MNRPSSIDSVEVDPGEVRLWGRLFIFIFSLPSLPWIVKYKLTLSESTKSPANNAFILWATSRYYFFLICYLFFFEYSSNNNTESRSELGLELSYIQLENHWYFWMASIFRAKRHRRASVDSRWWRRRRRKRRRRRIEGQNSGSEAEQDIWWWNSDTKRAECGFSKGCYRWDHRAQR